MPQQAPDVFQVIADPSRREMLKLLSRETMTINSLAQNFEMSRPAVSKHLKVLHGAGFISIRNSGRERYCELRQEGFKELQQWIDYFDKFWVSRLKTLETLLKNREPKS